MQIHRFLFSRILLACVLTSIALQAYTQKVGKTDQSVPFKPLPTCKGWEDDHHFLLQYTNSDYSQGSLFLVDARTGVEVVAVEAKQNKEEEKVWTAFTAKNDLYVIDLVTNKQRRLTTDGSDTILNGYASWVYMEEVFGRRGYNAYWWAPDFKHLAFFRFDDSKVPVFSIVDSRGQHGNLVKQRYPKAGDANPQVKVGIVKPESGPIVWTDFDEQKDQYFGKPKWRPDGKKLLIERLNRAQDSLSVYEVNPANGSKKLIYQEYQKTWIDLDKPERITFLKQNNGFILQSDRTGWNHLYLYNAADKLINQITDGSYAVLQIKHIDEQSKEIYFTGRKDNMINVDLYRIKFDGSGLKRLSFGNFDFTVNSVSPSGEYFILTYSNVAIPERMVLIDKRGKVIKELADSRTTAFNAANFRKEEIVKVKSEDGKFDLPMRIVWPEKMEAGKKYPVSISIYGGPGNCKLNSSWGRSYTPVDSLIYVRMEHRGSGLSGKPGMNYLHRNLGYWEMQDYIQCVKWLIANAHVDAVRVRIGGASYGGYLTCLALTYGADYFTEGTALAPVTHWSLYDTNYTERYMDTPEENQEGYKSSSVFTYANKLKGKLRIEHGMIDDNVHLQNSVQLVDTLQKLGKKFEMMFYPNRKH